MRTVEPLTNSLMIRLNDGERSMTRTHHHKLFVCCVIRTLRSFQQKIQLKIKKLNTQNKHISDQITILCIDL